MDFTIEGSPGSIRAGAATARAKGRLFIDTGHALAKVTTDGWTGRAADHFRDAFAAEPERWLQAGEGFLGAAAALDRYADALESAGSRADWARREYERGERVTEEARAAYDADVSRARSEVAEAAAQGQLMTLTIIPFRDPGQAVRDGAVAEYGSARADLEAAAHLCADGVRAGCAAAPAERKWWESGLAAVGGFFVGAGEAIADLLTLPGSPISMLQDSIDVATGRLTPEEMATKYRLGVEQVGALLQSLQDDPVEFGKNLGKALLDWDTWADDPARALGHLVPDAIVAVATGGTGAAATRGVKGGADAVDALADIARTGDRIDDVAGVGKLDDLDVLDDVDDLGRLDVDNFEALHRYDDLADLPVGERGTDAWADEVVARHPELSRDGALGLHDYTTNDGYKTMNGFSRNPDGVPTELHPEIQARIDRTSRGIAELPPYTGPTYRGSNVPKAVIDTLDDTGLYRDSAYSSSSLEARVGEEFLSGNPPKAHEDPVMFAIESRSGVNVQHFSRFPGEAEILFDRGTPFDVVSKEWDPDLKRWDIVLREQP